MSDTIANRMNQIKDIANRAVCAETARGWFDSVCIKAGVNVSARPVEGYAMPSGKAAVDYLQKAAEAMSTNIIELARVLMEKDHAAGAALLDPCTHMAEEHEPPPVVSDTNTFLGERDGQGREAHCRHLACPTSYICRHGCSDRIVKQD